MPNRHTALRNATLRLLSHAGLFCWLNETQGTYDAARACYRRNPLTLRGVPDILGIAADGRFVGIEIKTGKGRLSEEQVAFRGNAQVRNAVSIVARSTDDAVAQLRAAGVPLNIREESDRC